MPATGHSLARTLADDGFYRNQFETRTSGGALNTKVRKGWESALFGKCYDGADVEARDRVKYGCLSVVNDPRGVEASVCSKRNAPHLFRTVCGWELPAVRGLMERHPAYCIQLRGLFSSLNVDIV